MFPAKYFRDRLSVADRLNRKLCWGVEIEPTILICTLLGAISAYVFPGRNIDRIRFIELLVQFADPALKLEQISIPFLYWTLLSKDPQLAAQLVNAIPKLRSWTAQVFIDDEIDCSETEIQSLLPTLTGARKFSYAALMYTSLRNGAVHESRFAPGLSGHAQTRRAARISYVNRMSDDRKTQLHELHFHYPWLQKVVLSVLANLEKLPVPDAGLPVPHVWWAAKP